MKIKNTSKHAQNRLTFLFYITTITVLTIISLSPFTVNQKKVQAASSPSFAKTYHTLTVSEKVQYKITNLKKSNTVRFTVSNSTLASIGKKTGLLTAKKAGKLTVKANIYNKKQKKIKTLTNTITIQDKKKILPNAIFKVKGNINPWDFTLSLTCSRILLKSEINTDKLTILPKGKKSPKLSASFTNLSADGKEVTYTLNPASQLKLCPGDFSMDGDYTLESLCFSKKLSLSYQERLTNNTLSGFVLSTDGNSVQNALVSLKKDDTTVKECYTDKDGHYNLTNISKGTSLDIEKSGFQKTSIQNPAISSKGTTCENVILRSTKETEAAIDCLVTNSENQPISDASVYILDFEEKNILYSGSTNSSGELLLTNSSSLSAAPCSILTLSNQSQLTYSPHSDFSSTNRKVLSPSVLNCTNHYTVYITKFSSDKTLTSYQTRKLSFSLSNLITNCLSIHVQLEPCQPTCIKNLSIDCCSPPSLFRSLNLQFYSADDISCFYQYSIKKNNFNLNPDEKQITLSSLLLPISLPDGIFYLSIQALSEENRILSQSPLTAVQVTNGIISLPSISLLQPRCTRILAYGNFDCNPFSKCSFALCQKYQGHYFLTGIFYTENFVNSANPIESQMNMQAYPLGSSPRGNKSNIYTADLYLNNLLPQQNYFLIPLFGSVLAKEYLGFTTTEDNTFLTKENAELSLPLAQISCSLAENTHNSTVTANDILSSNMFHLTFDSDYIFYQTPDDFYHNTINMSYQKDDKITQDFIRSQITYPNCVIAFYQTNGTLLTATLTTSPASQPSGMKETKKYTKYVYSVANYSSDNSSTDSIIDIYQNKKILVTSQSSYL